MHKMRVLGRFVRELLRGLDEMPTFTDVVGKV